MAHPRNLEVLALLGGGLASVAGIVLIAKGHTREAYAFGAAGALLGATVGAVRILGRAPAQVIPPAA